MAKKTGPDTIVTNRRARFDYDITETLEAGLVLTGTEVKSLRAGKASIAEAFATVRGGEGWLVQAHIPEYDFGNRHNHDPTRRRKLLLHRSEIDRCEKFTQEQGRTLVPLRLYWKNGRAKLLIGLGKGRARHDKRATIAKRDADRDIQRALRERQKA
ncbi:MAG TPA: SsrA-binding protein SmpB [Egibacteraceae bacterium]|jgi:SsrA-binding protein|nr:SsrA-binding protein SmpB [Egibacteraceae bacterium]